MTKMKVELEIIKGKDKEKILCGSRSIEDYRKEFQDAQNEYKSLNKSHGVIEIELSINDWKYIIESKEISIENKKLFLGEYSTDIIKRGDNIYLVNQKITDKMFEYTYIDENIVEIIKKLVELKYEFYEPTLEPLVLTISKERKGPIMVRNIHYVTGY